MNMVNTVEINNVLLLMVKSPYSRQILGINEKSHSRENSYGQTLDLDKKVFITRLTHPFAVTLSNSEGVLR
jgi:hypothetical protein